MNARSVINKPELLENLIIDHEPHLAAITETWLTPDVFDHEFAPPNYSVIRKDRPTRGGGVALLIKKGLSFVALPDVQSAEAIFCKLLCDGASIFIGCVYRSPNSGDASISAIHDYMQRHTFGSRVVLMGDFNLPDINWNSMCYSSSASDTLFDLMLTFNLHQVVSRPTRSQGISQNILDLIFFSNHFDINRIKTDVVHGISDHDVPVCFVPLDGTITTHSSVSVVTDFENADDDSVLTHLAHEFQHFSETGSHASIDVDSLWLHFKSVVLYCIAHYIPTKTKRPPKNNPWITREVIQAKRRLKRLRRAIKTKGGGESEIQKLSEAIAEFKLKAKRAKQHYFDVVLPNFLVDNPQRFWNHFRTNKTVTPHLLPEEKKTKANAYNNFFQSVFTVDDNIIPAIKTKQYTEIDKLDITDAGIFNLLLKLDPKKGSGPDDIPNTFLKRYAEWCSRYLGLIFRKSLSTSQLPQEWKIAKIKPIHKGGDADSPSNFRPISLTSTSCKLLEHIILKHMTVFLERINFFSPNQHGFRSGLSTVTQLTELVHNLAATINNRGQTDMILLDLSKAFDCVCHSKLIAKVEDVFGIGELSGWVKCFLNNRSQFVIYEHTLSNTVAVTSGVPQGSVLGPLLFLLYINDIAANIKCNIKLFADDCVIYKEISHYSDHNELNDSLADIANWCSSWQMTLNVQKSAIMTVTRKALPSTFTYVINSTPLNRVDEHKYLGVTITSDLKWDKHISKIISKALRKLFFLKRSLAHATTATKLLAYTSFVRPVLEYANTVWFPHTVTNIKKLESIQRKAVRFIHNKYKRTDSPTHLLMKSGLRKLSTRAKHARLKFLFQLLKNNYRIDISKYISFSQARPTRNKHAHTLTEYACKNDTFKYSFFPLAISEWNQLDATITNIESLSEFMAQIEKNVFA